MINTTRWSPDTCNCVLEYTWDTSLSEENRVHTPAAIIAQCNAHAVETKSTVHAKVTDENQTKNKIMQYIADNLPSHAKLSDDGVNKIPDLDKIQWSYDNNRKLLVNLKNATSAQKTLFKTGLLAKFINKVDLI